MDGQKMKIKSMDDLLAWKKQDNNSIDLRMAYIDIAGDLVSGVVLSQIIYWHLPTSEGKSRLRVKANDGQKWMAKTFDEWHKETRLTKHQISKALTHLEKMGLIECKVMRFNGSPTKHVKLNKVALFRLMPEFEQSKVKKAEMESEKSGDGKLKDRRWKVKRPEMESEKNRHSITETHTETHTEKAEETPIPPTGASQGQIKTPFNEFWAQYPNKQGKAKAQRHWGKMPEQDRQKAIADVERRLKADPQWIKNGGAFIPHGSTYLNQKRYLDEWKPKPQQIRPELKLGPGAAVETGEKPMSATQRARAHLAAGGSIFDEKWSV